MQGSTSQTVLDVSPGDVVGAWWGHVLGGAQYANDPDNPIAKSHKGPIMAYLAKVDNAATASHSNLQWYKIAEDGFDVSSRTWGVDKSKSCSNANFFRCRFVPSRRMLNEVLPFH